MRDHDDTTIPSQPECPWCDRKWQPVSNDGVYLSCPECGCIVGELEAAGANPRGSW